MLNSQLEQISQFKTYRSSEMNDQLRNRLSIDSRFYERNAMIMQIIATLIEIEPRLDHYPTRSANTDLRFGRKIPTLDGKNLGAHVFELRFQQDSLLYKMSARLTGFEKVPNDGFGKIDDQASLDAVLAELRARAQAIRDWVAGESSAARRPRDYTLADKRPTWGGVTKSALLHAVAQCEREQRFSTTADGDDAFLVYQEHSYSARLICQIAFIHVHNQEPQKSRLADSRHNVDFLLKHGFLIKYKDRLFDPKDSLTHNLRLLSDLVDSNDYIEVIPPYSASAVLTDTSTDATIKQRIMEARVGQSDFRRAVLRHWGNACAVTGIHLQELLIASHIKPWAAPTISGVERLDPMNGLALIPTLDKLFDLGYISFTDSGEMLFCAVLSELSNRSPLVPPEQTSLRRQPSAAMCKYLSYHRTTVFKDAEKNAHDS